MKRRLFWKILVGFWLTFILIVVGILCMIQPFTVYILSYGFVITLIGMIGFSVFSHL